MCKSCEKCGENFNPGVSESRYCKTCLVRLGFVPHSTGPPVRPNAQDFFEKSLNEPILDVWLMEYEQRREEREESPRKTQEFVWPPIRPASGGSRFRRAHSERDN